MDRFRGIFPQECARYISSLEDFSFLYEIPWTSKEEKDSFRYSLFRHFVRSSSADDISEIAGF